MSHIADKTFTRQDISSIAHFPGTEKIELIVENLSTIKPKKIEWIWQDIIAVGKITLFAGEPGVGKSQLLLYIACILSNGGKFHYATSNVKSGKVLLIAGEDQMDDTVIPRLLALGANIDNIEYVKGIKKLDKNGLEYYESISLNDHLPDIEAIIIKGKYLAVIIDPISMFLGNADENKNKEIRSILARINAVCDRRKVAFILNSHFTKPSGSITKNAIYRVMGSIGFAAAARIVYGIMKDPEDPDRRLFIPIKNNIAQDKEGFAFNVKLVNFAFDDFDMTIGRIEWLNEKVTQTANEILNTIIESVPPKLQEAQDFLLDILKDGSVSLSKIRKEATDKGISADRLYKAKAVLNIFEDTNPVSNRGKLWMLSP